MKYTYAFILGFMLFSPTFATKLTDFSVSDKGVKYLVSEADCYGDGYTLEKVYTISAIDEQSKEVLGSFNWSFEPLAPNLYSPKVCYPFYGKVEAGYLILATSRQFYTVRPLFPTAEIFEQLYRENKLSIYSDLIPTATKVGLCLSNFENRVASCWQTIVSTVVHRVPVPGYVEQESSDQSESQDDQSENLTAAGRLMQLAHPSYTDYLKTDDWKLDRKGFLHQLCVDLWYGKMDEAIAVIIGLKGLGDSLPEFGGTL